MDAFKTFWRQLSPEQRDAFAQKVHTTPGYCHQIAYGKSIELGLADAIVAVAPDFGGQLSLAQLKLTDRARAQDQVRRGSPAGGGWDGTERRAAAS